MLDESARKSDCFPVQIARVARLAARLEVAQSRRKRAARNVELHLIGPEPSARIKTHQGCLCASIAPAPEAFETVIPLARRPMCRPTDFARLVASIKETAEERTGA